MKKTLFPIILFSLIIAGCAKDKSQNPFAVKKSAGAGLRLFLPMFGLIGLDYGWGLDPLSPGDAGYVPSLHERSVFKPQGEFHFTIGMNIGEL